MPVCLTKLPQTAITRQVVRMALRSGLHPHIPFEPYRGKYEVCVDAMQGPDSLFGTIKVGARSGRILSACLLPHNGAEPINTRGALSTRRALKRLTDWKD